MQKKFFRCFTIVNRLLTHPLRHRYLKSSPTLYPNYVPLLRAHVTYTFCVHLTRTAIIMIFLFLDKNCNPERYQFWPFVTRSHNTVHSYRYSHFNQNRFDVGTVVAGVHSNLCFKHRLKRPIISTWIQTNNWAAKKSSQRTNKLVGIGIAMHCFMRGIVWSRSYI